MLLERFLHEHPLISHLNDMCSTNLDIFMNSLFLIISIVIGDMCPFTFLHPSVCESPSFKFHVNTHVVIELHTASSLLINNTPSHLVAFKLTFQPWFLAMPQPSRLAVREVSFHSRAWLLLKA